ncbi:MAG: radical SAM protein [Ruminococcus sp.]|nr:radical SAM protein [Ruminococcus sp.]
MKHSNISIFIPHIGCPHRCSFCDQRTISGAEKIPHGDDVREICEKALAEVKFPENTEIAFFGGSFTAIPRAYMTELLEAAYSFVGEGKFKGIRLSTRPDCIDREVLTILKKYGVTSIELGAQSMSNKVLKANQRGHSADDVEKAAKLIREFGFELGLQMMVGLYKSDMADEFETLDKIAAIRPDTVRIYPVVILDGTKLGELYKSGEYSTFSFDEVTEFAAIAMMKFEYEGIKVIKCGLHASEFVERDMLGGFYHPAFRELCEADIYKRAIHRAVADKESGILQILKRKVKGVSIAVHPSCISKAIGQNKSNIKYFQELGLNIKIIGDENIPKYQVELR